MEPRALGSPHQVQAHLRKWHPIHIETVPFNAHRQPVFLQGRPVVLVVPSHPGADYLEQDPYLAWLFRPLQPIVLFGYDASTKRVAGHKHLCVIRWFREHFLFVSSRYECQYDPFQGRAMGIHKRAGALNIPWWDGSGKIVFEQYDLDP